MSFIKTLRSRSVCTRTLLVITIGICAYALSFLAGVSTLAASLVVTALLVLLFHPVFEKPRPLKAVAVFCVAAFLIASAFGVFGTRQDFVNGFNQGYHCR